MSTERLSPGGAYVNETETHQALLPDGTYINETVTAAGGGVFIPIIGRGPGMALVGSGGLVG